MAKNFKRIILFPYLLLAFLIFTLGVSVFLIKLETRTKSHALEEDLSIKSNQKQPLYSPTTLLITLSPEIASKISHQETNFGIEKIDNLIINDLKKISPLLSPAKKTTHSKNINLARLQTSYILEFEKNTNIKKIKDQLEKLPEIITADFNHVYEIKRLPFDTYISKDGKNWTQKAWGQNYLDSWGLKIINMENAWKIRHHAQKAVVAIVDTGIDYLHPDIKENLWKNPGEIPQNNIDDDQNGFIDDIYGFNFTDLSQNNEIMDDNSHGTHVAGIIGAVADNKQGISGVFWRGNIMTVKFLDKNGAGYLSDAVKAIVYAADNNADIINCSWGIGFPKPASLFIKQAISYATDKGALVIAAAGNESDNVGTENLGYEPASVEEVMAVSSVERDRSLSWFSNYGPKIEVAAPGGDYILSLLSSKANLTYDELERKVTDKYIRFKGTSMAAPYVSGAAALVKTHFPHLSMQEVRQRIRGTAIQRKIPLDKKFIGAGIINVNKALTQKIPAKIIVSDIDFGVTKNRNKRLDPNESVRLSLKLKNYWQELENITIWLTSKSPSLNIKDKKVTVKNLKPGKEIFLDREFPIKIKSTAKPSEIVTIVINLKYHQNNKKITDKIPFSQRIGLSPIQKLQVFPGNKSVELSWEPSKEEGIVGYNIYRKKDHQDNFSLVNSQPVTHPYFRYVDKNLENNTTYQYQIKAVDSAKMESEQNKIETATPQDKGLTFVEEKILTDFPAGPVDILWSGYDKENNLWIASYNSDQQIRINPQLLTPQISLIKSNGEIIKSNDYPIPPLFSDTPNFDTDFFLDQNYLFLIFYGYNFKAPDLNIIRIYQFQLNQEEITTNLIFEGKPDQVNNQYPISLKAAKMNNNKFTILLLYPNHSLNIYLFDHQGNITSTAKYEKIFPSSSQIQITDIKMIADKDNNLNIIIAFTLQKSRYKYLAHLHHNFSQQTQTFDIIDKFQCLKGFNLFRNQNNLYLLFDGNCYALSYKKFTNNSWSPAYHFWEALPYKFNQDFDNVILDENNNILGAILRADLWDDGFGYLNTLSAIKINTRTNKLLKPYNIDSEKKENEKEDPDLSNTAHITVYSVATKNNKLSIFWHISQRGQGEMKPREKHILLTTFNLN